jgi:DNA-binding NarL/FixJ family response regulator
MRVVIVDQDLKAGRALAAAVEQMLPSVDVLLYAQPQEALNGIEAHSPDVTFVAPTVNGVAGPEFLAKARAISEAPEQKGTKYVGMVDSPDADASIAWISAGAKLVVARPVDSLGIRTALRHVAGGIDA